MRRTLIPWLVASTLFVISPCFADVPAYSVTKEKSFLKFYAIQNGAPIEGKFSEFTADIRFDPEKLAESHIKVEVATGSVQVADDDIGKNIKMPTWLDVDAFPKAVFESKTITRMPSTDNYYSEGTLTLRGKSMPATLNFQMEHFDNSSAVAKGYVTVHRKDFGVGSGEWARDDVIKDEVRVEFRIAAQKK